MMKARSQLRAFARARLTASWLAVVPCLACIVRVDESAASTDGTASLATSAGADSNRARVVRAESAAPAVPFRVITWNVEWLGDPEHGPMDDGRQLDGVVDVLLRWPGEIVALQEVADEGAFATLRASLPGVDGVLGRGPGSQRLALLYAVERFELLTSDEIAGLDDAGRPPLHVTLLDRTTARAIDVVVIHAKAGIDAGSWERRRRFADALGEVLAARETAAPTIMLGDFNDELSRSLVEGLASPYASLLADEHWYAATSVLEHTGTEGSTVWESNIDHVVLSADLAPALWPASVDVLRDEIVSQKPDFSELVSDHFPVTLRLAP